MRNGLGALVVIWLVVGLVAAFQRGYFSDHRDVSCKSAGTTVVTVIAGPLNYVGANPKIHCKLPAPSK